MENMDKEIEQAAANLANPNACKTANWVEGAKYMAERMYSEEEVLGLLVEMNEWPTTFNGVEEVEEWFEQFKKK